MYKKFIAFLLVIVFVFTLSLGIGCTPQKKPAPTPQDKNRSDFRNNITGERIEENRTEVRNEESVNKANKLAEMITDEIPAVNRATVIFAEENVYVGIDLKANTSGNKAQAVKKEIAGMAKELDPDVERVYVTEDADSYTRLQQIAKDIEKGKPVSGFLVELQNIFRRVTPSMD